MAVGTDNEEQSWTGAPGYNSSLVSIQLKSISIGIKLQSISLSLGIHTEKWTSTCQSKIWVLVKMWIVKTFKSEQPGFDPLQASRVTYIRIEKYHLHRIRETIGKVMATRQKSLRMIVIILNIGNKCGTLEETRILKWFWKPPRIVTIIGMIPSLRKNRVKIMKTSQKGTGTGTGIPKTTICVNLIEIVINIFSFNLLSNCHLNHHHHLSVGRVFEALACHWLLSRAWNRPVYADLHIGPLEITTIRTIIIIIITMKV